MEGLFHSCCCKCYWCSRASNDEKKQQLEEEIKRLKKELKVNELKSELIELQHKEIEIINRRTEIHEEIRRLNSL